MAEDIYFRSLVQKLYGLYGRMESSRKIRVFRVFHCDCESIGWKYLNIFQVKERVSYFCNIGLFVIIVILILS